MTEKPSIPFAETVALLLKNAGVNADEQLARSLAMAIAIKFQETQAERIRAAAMEEAAQVAEKNAVKQGVLREKFPPDGESWTAFDAAEACATNIAASIRALAPTPPGMVCVPVEPTEGMATDGARALRDTFRDANQHARAKKVYRAMLAAAPGVKE